MELTEQQKRDIEFAGDPREIVRRIRAAEASHKAFDRRRADMVKKYPHQWAAVLGGEIVVRAQRLDELAEKVDKKGIKRSETFFDYLDPNPLPRIL